MNKKIHCVAFAEYGPLWTTPKIKNSNKQRTTRRPFAVENMKILVRISSNKPLKWLWFHLKYVVFFLFFRVSCIVSFSVNITVASFVHFSNSNSYHKQKQVKSVGNIYYLLAKPVGNEYYLLMVNNNYYFTGNATHCVCR